MIESPSRTAEVHIRGERFIVGTNESAHEEFWRHVSDWERETFSFVDACAKPGATFVDIGAWIGPITLLAARRGARVISLEPDPIAFSALERNLSLNGLSAELIPAALHTDERGLEFYEGHMGFGDSTSSSLHFSNGRNITVPSITASMLMDRISTAHAEVAFKIDIEGHEYVVGETISEVRKSLLDSGVKVSLNLSVHPRLLRDSLRRDNARFPKAVARSKTRRLLKALGPESSFLCGDGVSRSAREVLSRYVPMWRRRTRNFTVVLAD